MKGCKGLCDSMPNDRPFGNAYATHALCGRCDKWIRKTLLINNNCPCCKRIPRLLSRKNKQQLAIRIGEKTNMINKSFLVKLSS